MELVEVAQHGVARAAGDEAGPVVERLAVVLGEVDAALLHFDEHDGLPDVVGEAGATAVLGGLADPAFGLAADIERAGVAEGDHEVVDEDLRLAFFVAGDVRAGPGAEGRRVFRIGGSLMEEIAVD